MHQLTLVYLHLGTIVPAFILGSYLLINKKGTKNHKQLGLLYMLLMLATASIALLIPAQVGPALLRHFGFIHILSLVTILTVIVAYRAVRAGNIRRHKLSMIGLYVGGMLLAGGFAFAPGRLLHTWLFGAS